jgi:hypothetical protein
LVSVRNTEHGFCGPDDERFRDVDRLGAFDDLLESEGAFRLVLAERLGFLVFGSVSSCSSLRLFAGRPLAGTGSLVLFKDGRVFGLVSAFSDDESTESSAFFNRRERLRLGALSSAVVTCSKIKVLLSAECRPLVACAHPFPDADRVFPRLETSP